MISGEKCMSAILFEAVILIVLFNLSVFSEDSTGNIAVSLSSASEFNVENAESKKAATLEELRKEILYCKENYGKDTNLLDVKKGGRFLAPKITDAIIADKYWQYGDYLRSAEYYYRDWEIYKNDKKSWERTAMGDDNPLLMSIAALGVLQHFGKVVEYYSEYYQYEMATKYKPLSDTTLLTSNFEKYKESWPSLAKQYQEMMTNWTSAKQFAKTTRPKPLDLAVQHHEWFYSDRQAEVLKALAYYHKHKVRFMLEKALNHKNPAVAAKAKQYLESLPKDDEYKGITK